MSEVYGRNGYNSIANNLFNSMIGVPQKRVIVSVNGISEAKNFMLERGENIILRDSNDDTIYVKACDEFGKCTLKVYDCTDVTEQRLAASQTETSISKSDLDKFRVEIKTMIEEALDGKHNAKRNCNTAERE